MAGDTYVYVMYRRGTAVNPSLAPTKQVRGSDNTAQQQSRPNLIVLRSSSTFNCQAILPPLLSRPDGYVGYATLVGLKDIQQTTHYTYNISPVDCCV